MKKGKKKSPENYLFYSRENSLYVAWACLRNEFLLFLNPNFKSLGHLSRYVSDLVGNIEDRFAHDAAQLSCL